MFGLSDGEEITTLYFLRFDTVPECDGQTDGQTFLLWLYRRLHSLLY